MPLLAIRYSDASARRRLNPIEIDRRARGAMEESLAYLKAEVRKPIPVDRGIARGAIATEIRGTTVDLRGVVAPIGPGAALATRYIDVLERGRRAGSKAPPVAEIQAWMSRKGIAGGRRRAFLIARAIGRRGFKGRPNGWQMFQQAYDRGAPVVKRIFARHFRGL